MRTRKLTNGKVKGVKFNLENKNDDDLKAAKAKILKELAEQEKKNKDWFDQEMDKNLKK